MPTRRLLLLCILLPLPLAAQAPSFPGTTAEVVAWNFAGFTPIPPARQEQIVRALEDLDAEVIAAVEVNPDNVLHDVAAALTERGSCHNSMILPQTAGQNIGVIFKCGVEVNNARLVPNSDDGNSALRKAFAANVRVGGFDFLLIVLHLKAGRTSADRAIRDRQVDHIAAFIAAETGNTASERDVLVVGDYNMIPGEDAATFQRLNPSGFLRFVSSTDLVGQSSHLPAATPCGGNLLDGFAISAVHTGEYLEATLRIYPAQLEPRLSLCEFRGVVSDHLPLTARFRVVEDDDGPGVEGSGADVRIVALLPNPDGIDHGAEQVTLRNLGAASVSLVGWKVVDAGGNEAVLSGTIAAGATLTVTLDRPAMLNNDGGDTVRLVSPTLTEHVVTYTVLLASGQVIQCGADNVCR